MDRDPRTTPFGRPRIVVAGLAAASCAAALPATRNGGDAWPGFAVLLIGGQAFSVDEFRWLANVVFFVAATVLLLSGKRALPAAPIGLAFTGLAASCLVIPVRWVQGSGASGLSHGFATLEIGACLWIASFALLFVASLAPNPQRTPAPRTGSFPASVRSGSARPASSEASR
ncbi:MAG: hypothetical protein N2544_13500 [Burkholderiales bacterium]|nr:hypothetical protein [Burkholderiales bacterium]